MKHGVSQVMGVRGCLSAAIGTLLACVAFAAKPAQTSQHTLPPPQWTALVGTFDKTLADDHIVGGSVALIERGRIVARHDFGFSDSAKSKRVDSETIFHWASITKTLNAISIMQLRDRGLLQLEDRITRYVPELRRIHDPYGPIDDITLRMLMTHSAGFQSRTWSYSRGLSWEPFEPTTWEQLVAMMPYQQVEFRPGSRFGYSNPAWLYLARALELLTGDQWENYIQKNVFAPLGMSHSYFGSTPAYLQTHRSHRYVITVGKDGKPDTADLGADFDPGATIPNGGWNGPLSDAAAYVAFLTSATMGNEDTQSRFDSVLKRSTLEEMWLPQIKISSDASKSADMGLGYFLISQDMHRIIGHTGGQGGFTSFLYFDHDTGRGIVAAFNTAITAENADFDRHSYSTIRDQALKVLADGR